MGEGNWESGGGKEELQRGTYPPAQVSSHDSFQARGHMEAEHVKMDSLKAPLEMCLDNPSSTDVLAWRLLLY